MLVRPSDSCIFASHPCTHMVNYNVRLQHVRHGLISGARTPGMLSHLRRECIGKGPFAGLQTPALRLLTSGSASLAPPAEDVLDVAIVGGGMVGAALAAALREHQCPPLAAPSHHVPRTLTTVLMTLHATQGLAT